MKITLEYYDTKITHEEEGNDFSSEELKGIFSRMLVQVTFPPDVIELPGGDKYVCTIKEAEDDTLQG